MNAPCRSMSVFQRKAAVGAALLLVAILAWALHAYRRTPAAPASPPSVATPAQDERDAKLRRLAVGSWQDEYQGRRTMVLNTDGTGTMRVELSGIAATLFAAQLNFTLHWSITDGRLQEQTTGGEPATKVQMILKLYGDRVDQPILALDERRLLLLDKDGATRYDWQRVPPAAQP